MRNNQILRRKLETIWLKHFSDVAMLNPIQIKFGRKARKRLGSIRECIHTSRDNETLILLNGHFKDKKIPDFVIDATIAHELCHYAQGFGSRLPQLSKFPHRGGAVDKEMENRGLDHLVQKEKRWLDKNWYNWLSANH